ncbi:hypothetical protein JH06_5418 [Blastocystis sp. subtype 4]|uniref:hypothetical protein n=1 Tax=Blastocystis sp. subtype 4 TaxID=944170 RepID=UPI000711375C|nr:hypothetical protein JH06_5418 [Blastocystis sp. subtype 4]KNB41447.1 hypothetical protein JH06_5418 [Blastocystis sp. subtype 4]|eukprot:XP_014524890.1 hypothetical protein JH06_5418 [Blastocystis sp. subtype 4]
MMKGFVREGRGKEFGIDGKRVLYVGEWKKGLRDGYGSEIKGYCPVYIGEWKNGLRHGTGRELNENGTVMRKGRWIEGVYEDAIKRFEDGYGNDLSVFDIDCLKGIERLEIGNDCLKKVTLFVIDRLNELKSMKIGEKSFSVDKENGKGSKCLIMNCDQLKQIYFGDRSFLLYESFELKNLPSLTTLEMGCASFLKCHLIVFDNLIPLQSITLELGALEGDEDTIESNELIMKNLPFLSIQRRWSQLLVCRQNIPSLTSNGIDLGDDDTFSEVNELNSSNADSLEHYITLNSYVTPSKHLLSLDRSAFWIWDISQMNEICNSVESIVIQGGVGRDEEKSFTLSNLPSLITLEMGCGAFCICHSIVFDNLTQLQSIILGSFALSAEDNDVEKESSSLRMKNLPSLNVLKGNDNNFRFIVKVILENIPLLTEDGVQMKESSFTEVRELHSSSMINELILN